MVRSKEFDAAAPNVSEVRKRGEAEAHRPGNKSQAKEQPRNLLDLIRLISVRKILHANQIPPEIVANPEKKVAELSAKLATGQERDKQSARKEIRQILGAANQTQDAEEKIQLFASDPQNSDRKDLGIVDAAHKFGPKIRSGSDSSAVSQAKTLEKEIFDHFQKDNVAKIMRGEAIPNDPNGDLTNEVKATTKQLYERLEKWVAEKLKIPENHEELAAIRARFEELRVRVDLEQVRELPKGSAHSPLEYQKDHFAVNDPRELLKIRDVPSGNSRDEDELALNKFKAMVREDFDDDTPFVKQKNNDEVLEAIQVTSSWRSGIKELVGTENRVAMEDEIDAVLLMVEEAYIEEVAERMIDNLKVEEDDPYRGRIVDWVREAVNMRRGKGKLAGNGSFDKGVLNWDELQKDVLESRVKQEQFDNAMKSRGRGKFAAPEMSNVANSGGFPPDMYINSRDRVATLEAMEKILNNMGLDKFSVEDLISKEPVMRGKVDQAMEAHIRGMGLAPLAEERELASARGHLESLRAMVEAQRGGENLMFARLEKELEAGDYQLYLWDLKAYFERVGPRESSSDWELAMIVRRAKEVLSRPEVFDGELGNNWGIWESQLFGRGNFCEMGSKDYEGRAPIVLNQNAIFQSLSPEQQWMNGILVHVKSWDEEAGEYRDMGEKKVLSTLAYYQMLKRDAYADMTMSTEVNSVDGMQQRVMLCLLYGDGTYTSDGPVVEINGESVKTKDIFDSQGRKIGNTNDLTTFEFFDGAGQTKEGKEIKDRNLSRLLGDSLVLSRWAENTWYYSLEWRKNNLDFNLDRYRRINKNILKLLALEAYDGHYGPAEPAMREMLKAGALLPDFFTYKLGDVEKSAVTQWLLKGGLNVEQAEWVAGFLGENVVQTVDIGKAKFNMGTLSVEDVRLKARQVSNLQEAWEIYVEREGNLRNGRDLSDVLDMNAIAAKRPEQRTGKEAFFLEQAQLFYGGIKAREITATNWQMLNGTSNVITKEGTNLGILDGRAVKILAERLVRQKDPTGRTHPPENVTWQWIFENFEYGALMDYDGMKKQSDVSDFMGYFADSEAVYGAMQKYAGCDAEWKVFEEICFTLNKYQPMPEVAKWAEETLGMENKLRTNPRESYEIPDSNDDYTTKYKKWKDPKTGKVWYLNDKDGFRVAHKTLVKHDLLGRSHLKKKRDLENYKRADIEVRAKRLFGKRILSEHGRERVLSDALGPKWYRILSRALWFDEPVFAFFELYEELKKYFGEVGKEVLEGVAK